MRQQDISMSDCDKISAATDVALDNAKKGMIGGKITAADQQELGSGLKLLLLINISTKFDFINQ